MTQDIENYRYYLEKAIYILFALTPFVIFCVIKFLKYLRKVNDEKFRKYIKSTEVDQDNKARSSKAPGNDYPAPATAARILEKIAVTVEEFTLFKKNLTLKDYAAEIEVTCDKHVSQVINYEMDMSYTKFCHTVKCENLLKQIRENPELYKDMLNDGLASLCGYKDARAFSDGMKIAFGMRPPQFLRRYMEHLSKPEADSRSIKNLVKDVQDEIQGIATSIVQ